VIVSTATGRFTAGAIDVLIHLPGDPEPKAPIIVCHSGDSDARQATGLFSLPDVKAKVRAAAALGHPVGCITQPLASYGNIPARSRVDDALTWMRNPVNGINATNDPAGVMGFSMGGTLTLNWVADNPDDTAWYATFLTPWNITSIYETDLGGVGHRAGIAAANSIIVGAPLPAGAAPDQRVAELVGIPGLLTGASDDLLSSGLAGFATDVEARYVNAGAVGHTTAAVSGVSTDLLVDLIRTHTT
jgi:acetyl esterase/lipase